MEYNLGVSMDSFENDFDNEDIAHEQIKQNEIIELIMAAFGEHEEPSSCESLSTSGSSHHSLDEQQMLHTNNNDNTITDENDVQQRNKLLLHNQSHQQVSTTPSLVPSRDVHDFEINGNHYMNDTRSPYDEHNNNEGEIPFNTTNHLIHSQSDTRSSRNTPDTGIQYVPDIDSMQIQYLYHTSSIDPNETRNQLNKLRILCSAKERQVSQFRNLCQEHREKYECDTRILKHKLQLSEGSRYDWEQGYQLIKTQREELVETNNQLQRTVKELALRIQQIEEKSSDVESLNESLHRKQQFESIARLQQDYERVLSTTREKYQQEVISLNEKLHTIQMNFQEKNVEVDELRVRLEVAYKNNEQALRERLETINHLNEQLQNCQRQYNDLLNTSSLESFNLTEVKRQLNRMTEDKDKLEFKCQELQSEIRTLRNHLPKNEHEVNNAIFFMKTTPIVKHDNSEDSALDESIINENIRLKGRIDEFVSNEKHLVELNEELQRKIQDYEHRLNRSDSSSSSSSNETVITPNIYKEQNRNLSNQIEILKKDYADLQEKYDYEKHELQTMIEQLREDVIDLDTTKQLYNKVCEEKISIEDKFRSKFEFELKTKLDELYQILEKDYKDKLSSYKNNQEQIEQVNPVIFNLKYNPNSEQSLNELYEEIERNKVEHEKQINELNNELDRLRTNDDAKNRLAYTEKEFEQLKQDYYNLNLKQKELLTTCSTLENQNRNLLSSIEQIEQEKLQLKQNFDNEKEKLLNELQKQDLLSTHNTIDRNQIHLNEDIETLKSRIDDYENAITQYDEYRAKLETNLQKLTQQRDTYKTELKSTREMLINKENEYNQLKIRFDEYEKQLQNNNEYDSQAQELNQNRLTIIQGTEHDYHEKLNSLEAEKSELEQRLKEANQALDLADSHLQQEIEKIKFNLEQEYNRRYEHDQKQHQHNLLPKEIEKQQSINSSDNSLQDTEEIKKMYRTEIDRLYRENIELSQHQAKLIETHQKQMQIMKKELDESYNNVINEFQREQTRLQTRYDQLKQQLTDAQKTIEQSKLNLNQLKTNHFNNMSTVKETSTNEKHTFTYDNKNRQDNIENRLDNLMKLLAQSNDALNQERILHTKQEYEYQQTISSLQKRIADMIRQHLEAVDEIKRVLHQERLTNQIRVIPRPTSVPEFAQTDFSTNNINSNHATTIENFRELFTIEMIALLRLTCKLIFDMHHKATAAQYMDNLEVPIKKQIQNELIRSRNSMMKEIRREIFEKMTRVLRSQGVPSTTIDMHIFELDRFLSQIAQDCLNSLTTSFPFPSNSSSLSFQITSPSQQNRAIVYHSLPTKSTPPLKKSVECLYMTPIVNKQPRPLTPRCRRILNNDCLSKSASNILTTSPHSTPGTNKFSRSIHKNVRTRTHRSEDGLISAVQQKIHLDDDYTLTLDAKEKEHQQPNIRSFAKPYGQKTLSLPGYAQSDGHYTISCTLSNNNQEQEDEDELTWPQQPSTTSPSTQTNGLRNFVRNGFKLFNTSPQKRIGK